jgi:hypothetical protein
MILALLITAAVALTVPGFVSAVRALPFVAVHVDAGVKPWACDVCMCFWSTALFAVIAAAWLREPLYAACAGPAYTLALVVLSHLERPPTMGPTGGLADTLEPPK